MNAWTLLQMEVRTRFGMADDFDEWERDMTDSDFACRECGHRRLEHEPYLWVVGKRALTPIEGHCNHLADDGTDRGSLACGCTGWR